MPDFQIVNSTEVQHVVAFVGGGGKGERVQSDHVFKTDTVWTNCGIHVPEYNGDIMPGDMPELAIYLVVEGILGFIFGDIHWRVA